MWQKTALITVIFTFTVLGAAAGGVWLGQKWATGELSSPLGTLVEPAPKPYLPYRIPVLSQLLPEKISPISVENQLTSTPEVTTFAFTFAPLGRKMTGHLQLPTSALSGDHTLPTIMMMRGYIPPESFATGSGTRNAGNRFAKSGFMTVAPDFFGFGQSENEPSDTWIGRFEKPLVVAELARSLETQPIVLPDGQTIKAGKIGLWGHSNGGQISLTSLEAFGFTYPTTLWAPVTAPFPYSLLFFTRDNEDEGKASRAWIASFEREYDVFDFTLTQHLDLLRAPIQLHQGSADTEALQTWSDEFARHLKAENTRRVKDSSQSAKPIEFTYHTYPGADHNLQPAWETVVERDIGFFGKYLR